MMRRLALYTVLVFVAASFSFGRTKVACVGNSITYGMTIVDREHNSYPARLQEMLGDEFEVGNFGKNGATLLRKGHRPYTEQEEYGNAVKFAPDIVVIHLGVNDTDPRDYPDFGDDFVKDYIALIDSFQSVNPNARFILANLSPLLSKHPRFRSGTLAWRDSIRALIPVIAEATGSELIDFGDALRDYPNLIADGIHPDAVGAEILAETVRGAVTGDYGGLKMAPIYGDGMVLQRYKPLKIRGTANAGDTVVVNLGGRVARAVADNRGRWAVVLPPMAECEGVTMTVACASDTLRFNDIAIGEVWLASGQSNMEFQLKNALTFPEDVKTVDDSLLRFFNMTPVALTNAYKWSAEERHQTNILKHYRETHWEKSSVETAGRFSAVAWYFAKMLRDSLNVPVGIINNPIGGSPAEAWVDIETLEHKMPEILVNYRTNDYLQPWVRQRIADNVAEMYSFVMNRHPYEPSYLFAAGIRPLDAYPIAGAIWYQGESNAHNTEVHEVLFHALVDSWRRNWNEPEMPFLFVQLSSINRPSWPIFRDSQRRLADEIPGVAMAVSSDQGHPTDVHPRNKKPVGQRLGRQALRRVYSMTNIIPEGPKILSAIRNYDGSIVLDFDYADGMTTNDGATPSTFEIAEFEGLYYPADSVIVQKDNKIKLYSKKVENPNFVRYGWQPFTTANLINGDSLPASTFKIAVEKPETDVEEGIENGISGAFVGVIDGHLIQAGGCNFPANPMAPDSKKKFYRGIYVLSSNGDEWTMNRIGQLPEAIAYGAAVSTPEGLVLVGGTNADGKALKSVSLLRLNESGEAVLSELPSLPVAIDNAYGAYAEGTVYVAGGNVDGVPANGLYALNLGDVEKGWQELRPFPGNPRVQPVMAAAAGNLYLWGGFAGRTAHREPSLNIDGYKYSIKKGKWTPLPVPVDADGEEISTGGGTAVTLSDGRIAVIGGVNKDIFLAALQNQAPDYLSHPIDWYRFNPNVLVFDPSENSWKIALRTPKTARAGAGLVAMPDGGIIVVGGELKPRIRTSEIFRVSLK